jgi:hypothetical protein
MATASRWLAHETGAVSDTMWRNGLIRCLSQIESINAQRKLEGRWGTTDPPSRLLRLIDYFS